MRSEVYSFLVNRHPGISYRYHKVHDDATGMRRMFSWAYLLWKISHIMYCSVDFSEEFQRWKYMKNAN